MLAYNGGGTSEATAAGIDVWYVGPDPPQRGAAMAGRDKLGFHLQDRRWRRQQHDRTCQGSRVETATHAHGERLAGEFLRHAGSRALQNESGPQQLISWPLQPPA